MDLKKMNNPMSNKPDTVTLRSAYVPREEITKAIPMPTSIEAKPVTTAPFIAKPQSTQLSKEEILNLAKENGFNLMEQEEEWVKFTIELKKYTTINFAKKESLVDMRS